MIGSADVFPAAEQRPGSLRVSVGGSLAFPLGLLSSTSAAVARAQEEIQRTRDQRRRMRASGAWPAKASAAQSEEPLQLGAAAPDELWDVFAPGSSGHEGDLPSPEPGSGGDRAERGPERDRPPWLGELPYAHLLRLWTRAKERAAVLPELPKMKRRRRARKRPSRSPSTLAAPVNHLARCAVEARNLPVVVVTGRDVVPWDYQHASAPPVGEGGTPIDGAHALPVPFDGDAAAASEWRSPHSPCVRTDGHGSKRSRRRARTPTGQQGGKSVIPIATRVLITMIVVTIWASQHSPDWAERGGEGAGETGNDGAPAIALSGDDGTGLDHAEPQAIPTADPAASQEAAMSEEREVEPEPPSSSEEQQPAETEVEPPAVQEEQPTAEIDSSWTRLYKDGLALREAGDFDGAIRALSAASRANQNHAQLAYELGYTLEKSGDRAGAIAAYRRAIALKPDHGYANYNLGYLLSRSGAPAATEHLQRAAELLPQNVHAHFAAAQALELEGDLSAAERAYQRVLDLESGPAIRADTRIRLQRLHEGRQETAP